ncbi:SH3 domain of the SH3b1 type [Sodalis glossinidius str. 'morsitans']|nr:SH3 domain of the SH3b1 type [Sodalis glossinidius str. 'morsitans']
MLHRTKLLCLTFPWLLSACNTDTYRLGVNDPVSLSYEVPAYLDTTKTLFPIENYSQSVDKWLPPDSDRINVSVIDNVVQQRYFSSLKSNYFGMNRQERSPWNPYYITSFLNSGTWVAARNANINRYLASNSISWGENFRIHSVHWKTKVKNNTDTSIDNIYQSSRRAIAIRETLLRDLPTIDPAYDDPREAGQGYPFDNLQNSAIRPGTPVYMLTESRDKSWTYVVSPTKTGWIHSEDIASVDQKFITDWVSLAKKHLGAFIKEPVTVQENGQYYFMARPGTILPFKDKQLGRFLVAVPVRMSGGSTEIRWVKLSDDEFTAMPWQMTPANIAKLMKSMSSKPYGWGNYNFYNDCSAEMHSLLMPFGILLPRDSSAQIQATARIVDLSKETMNARINYLKKHGKPFTTLVYIPGHIMLYIGNTIINGQEVPMTYQNIWGLRPRNSNSRSIIGGSVFFPILTFYPQNPELVSLADKKQFKLGFIE